jgi:hypothetical protein
MSAFDWESFLRQWSQAVLESMSDEQLSQLPQEVIASGWLGYPGATEEQICQTESRLGVKFPPSYREFLKVTDGWRQTTSFIRRLWSTEDIERFVVRHQKWIEAFTNHHENTQVSFEHAIELDELWEQTTVADEEYFVYGEEQDCSKLRVEYLRTAIEISDVVGDAIYLLNPQVVTEEGEWEAWFFGDWLPGADRYRSFREMMEAEYHNFLELRDSASEQSQPLTEPTSSAIAEPLTDSSAVSTPERQVPEAVVEKTAIPPSEPASEAESAVWRSLKRLIVEFQTRQIGDRVEYRTITTAQGEQENTWSGVGKRKLQQWLQEQLAEGISSPVKLVATSGSKAVTPPPAPVVSSVPSELPKPALDLTLEIDQLLIRQDSCLSAHILANPAMPKQLKKTGYASLTSQQPFSVEVVLKLVGQSLSKLPAQSVTYQVQFHAQNRTTGEWIVLGDTKPDDIDRDRRTYTAYLFGRTLEPGMYRLQVFTRLRGAAVALTSFELPLLNVV